MESIPDVTALLDAIGREGGIFALFALALLVGAVLYSRGMSLGSKRAKQLDEESKREHEAQLERERQNAEAYKGTTERMIGVVEGNTKAITSLSEIVRPIGPTLARIDRYIGSNEMGDEE